MAKTTETKKNEKSATIPPAKFKSGDSVVGILNRDEDATVSKEEKEAMTAETIMRIEGPFMVVDVVQNDGEKFPDLDTGWIVVLYDPKHPEMGSTMGHESDVFPATSEGKRAAEKRVKSYYFPRWDAWYDHRDYFHAKVARAAFSPAENSEKVKAWSESASREDVTRAASLVGVAKASGMSKDVARSAFLKAREAMVKDKGRHAEMVKRYKEARTTIGRILRKYETEKEAEFVSKVERAIGVETTARPAVKEATPATSTERPTVAEGKRVKVRRTSGEVQKGTVKGVRSDGRVSVKIDGDETIRIFRAEAITPIASARRAALETPGTDDR